MKKSDFRHQESIFTYLYGDYYYEVAFRQMADKNYHEVKVFTEKKDCVLKVIERTSANKTNALEYVIRGYNNDVF